MKIGSINLMKSFLILLMLGIQNPAFSEEVDFDLNQFLSTLSGVYVSIDKPSVILSIHVNANDNSIVVIDVSGTLEFLRDIGYISEEEYEQNITVSPMERHRENSCEVQQQGIYSLLNRCRCRRISECDTIFCRIQLNLKRFLLISKPLRTPRMFEKAPRLEALGLFFECVPLSNRSISKNGYWLIDVPSEIFDSLTDQRENLEGSFLHVI